MPSRRLIVLSAAAATALAGCKKDATSPPVPTSVVLSPTIVTLSSINETRLLRAAVLDQRGDTMTGQTIIWNSSNMAVAVVSATGVVQAVSNGSAQVTAVSGGLTSAPATVTVAQAAVALQKAAGDLQTDTVGQQLATALMVQANDALGSPVAGVTVTFVVTSGGGAVSTPSAVTAADGRASVMWTLGTGVGTAHQVTASAGGATAVTFSATPVAGAASALVLVSGDGQQGQPSMALSAPIVVQVNDQFGNPVSARQVDFLVTSGGGSVTPTSAPTGSNGRAQTAWTLGPGVGTQTLEAQSGALTGSPVALSATVSNLTLTSVQPDTLVEGQSATLTGDGFSTTPVNNTVTIGGSPATVTAASVTSLTVTVPAYDCQPARSVNVQVNVGGANSNTVEHPLKAAGIVSLAVGQQQIVLDPANFCLQFAASGASEAYLIGVQSLSETPSNLQVTRLISATGFPSPAPPALMPALQALAVGQPIQSSAREDRWARHRAAENVVRGADAQVIGSRSNAAAVALTPGAAQVIVPGTVNVGDTVKNVRIWTFTGTCATFDSIAVVVRAKGTRGIWVEDVSNPINGYTASDFDSLSNYLDNVIFDTDTSYFGDPGDLDGNARIVVVVTKEVNRRGSLLGFVGSCDFFTRASAPTSNEGEFFYAKAPDPTAVFGSTYTRDDAFADAPFLIAHEFTHIIQFGRRIPAGGAFTTWLLEGQATFAEEVNGFAVTGRTPGQNYGFAVAFNAPPSTPIDWHVSAFVDLVLYYGFESPTTRKAEAPHECTWIGLQSQGNTGPCISGREVYGVPWSLYRWASDHFGAGFSGGERGFHKALIGNPLGGYANFAGTIGVSIDTLLAQWAAALYVDDRVPGATARLTLPSWNLVNIESSLVATARLQPTEVGFAGFDLARNVRAGSSAYVRMSGTARPATAVRVRSSSDTALPTSMNVWIVRLQ